jgi:enoyl-CoA hydratase
MYTSILTSINEGILTVTINRPDKLNALNKSVFDELDHVMADVYSNPQIKGVIITGSGSKAFVAGADIAEFSSFSKEDATLLSLRGQAVFQKIESAPKPVIAAVNGFALGGGCELAMSCHFRVCSENAKFGQPEVNLGLIPGYGGTQRMTHLVGKGKSMEWHMTAKIVDAQEALASGLVNHVTTAEDLIPKTEALLQSIVVKAPIAISKLIECINFAVINDSAFTNGKTGFELEAEHFGDCFNTEDMKEGTTAFLEKRKAIFTGK